MSVGGVGDTPPPQVPEISAAATAPGAPTDVQLAKEMQLIHTLEKFLQPPSAYPQVYEYLNGVPAHGKTPAEPGLIQSLEDWTANPTKTGPEAMVVLLYRALTKTVLSNAIAKTTNTIDKTLLKTAVSAFEAGTAANKIIP